MLSNILDVVSYRNSTSNHNSGVGVNATMSLYLIEILHQTTTTIGALLSKIGLYLIEILHQTTTPPLLRARLACCILSKFYIKPQHECSPSMAFPGCILSKFYIKPQQQPNLLISTRGCILSKFYIKPQLRNRCYLNFVVVSYRNSTSNHNNSTHRYCRPRVVSYRNSTSNHNLKRSEATEAEVVSYRNSTSNHNRYRYKWD